MEERPPCQPSVPAPMAGKGGKAGWQLEIGGGVVAEEVGADGGEIRVVISTRGPADGGADHAASEGGIIRGGVDLDDGPRPEEGGDESGGGGDPGGPVPAEVRA